MIKKVILLFTLSLIFQIKYYGHTSYLMLSEHGVESEVIPETSAAEASKVLSYRVIEVPSDYPTIASAVSYSNDGDQIIISPGTYFESEIVIDKAITISSEWKLSGDESTIETTIIDSEDKILFTIIKDGVEVSGLTMINGDHTLNIEARVTIVHNHFRNNKDGMSFESNGGGYVAYNTAENDRDDALDLDIVSDGENRGSDILIEHNVFTNCNDDGIEIRLFKPHHQDINYTIRQNTIIGSKNAAIQLISYDEYTGKVFNIHHNIFTNCKTGLGCMEGAQTVEDLSGATKMNEIVYFYNNTVTGCQMGATGGNRVIAFNNLIAHNSIGGFKLFGENSVIRNNLFFENGSDDFIGLNPASIQDGNIFKIDPLVDPNTHYPSENSPCIDAGISKFEIESVQNPEVAREYISGNLPDIGALERGLGKSHSVRVKSFQVFAGENRAIEATQSQVVLEGRVLNAMDRSMNCTWSQEKGPVQAKLTNPDRMATSVRLPKEGIYRFSLTCSDGPSTSSDIVTIRNIHGGEGKQLFLNGDSPHIIEAENLAYSYGNVEIEKNEFVNMKISSQVEFSVGMAEASEYDLWVLLKSMNPGRNKLGVIFNNQDLGIVSGLKDKNFHWVKVPGKIKTTPGQWQLLINGLDGTVLLDKIIMSKEMNFVPY